MAGDVTQTGRWAEADVFRAPVGTLAPTTAEGALDADWKAVGFLDGEAGIVKAMEESSETLTVWGGTPVDSTSEFGGATFTFTAVEDNDEMFSIRYEGSAAPTTTVDTKTRVAKVPVRGEWAWLIRLQRPGKTKVTVVPKGKVAEAGEVNENETELPTQEITVNILSASDKTLFTELHSI